MLTLLLALQLTTEMTFPPAILNLQRLMAESIEGKAVIAKLEAARTEHLKTLEGKRAEVNQLIQQKAAAASIQRSQVELERMAEDADAQMTELQRALQVDFFKKVEPESEHCLDGTVGRYHHESHPAPQRRPQKPLSLPR